ncbi:MAG: response regulator transcription factor [Anaerolineae bacterium]|nr:response regulator transcription factor [Anaerolineae bacterium]
MPRDTDAKPPQIIYIGRADPAHDKLWQQFQAEGIGVGIAHTQRAGLQLAWDTKPLVVVINTANGAFTGERLCRALGRSLPHVQRLLLTEANSGAKVPCEKRLARPFTIARLRETVCKLLAAADPHVLRVGALQVNTATRVVSGPNGTQHLTPKQCELLSYLMRRPNQVFSRRQLMKDVWETPYVEDTRTLDVHMRWLREKVELDPERPALLVTKRGVGYMLVMPALEPEAEDLSDPEAD